MRIIAGTNKGKRLADVGSKNKGLRPTSDMAREALFSILSRWPKGSFLDMFSGTGAVALEALSRGYSPVWCVEHDRGAVACIRANAKGTDLSIIHKDALAVRSGAFSDVSVVFADPPYNNSLEMWGSMAEVLSGFLSPDGVLVWECPKTLDLSATARLSAVDERRYGSAKFVFFEISG
jgi:16S rRNA (guanine966-N2)-methyltransferase